MNFLSRNILRSINQLMSLLKAYLLKNSTQRTLRQKPGSKGFSLIELVVVIAVLAALAAIALPNFLGISDDASVRSAQTAAVNAMKECQATWARGKRDVTGANAQYFNGHSPTSPALLDVSEFLVYAFAAGTASPSAYSLAAVTDTEMLCFSGTNATPAKKDIVSQPTVAGKFPTFIVRANGRRVCSSGNQATFPETFNIGCSGTTGADGAWE